MENFNNKPTCEITRAKDVLNAISSMFPSDFEKCYSEYTNDGLIKWMVKTLQGIYEQEIEHGKDLLYKQDKMPSFANFRKLCISKGLWMSPLEAFLETIKYDRKLVNKIPLVAKEAMDESKLIHEVDYNSWARNDFIAIYEKLVDQKREVYSPVEYWYRPIKTKQNSQSKERVTMPPAIREEFSALIGRIKR